MSFADTTLAASSDCCAPADAAPAPVAPAPEPVISEPPHVDAAPLAPAPAPEPAHLDVAAPAAAPADAGGSPWAMSGPGVDPAPAAGSDAHTGLSFPGDAPWSMGGDNVNGVLASSDAGSHPVSGGTSWGMGGTDVDTALAGSPATPHDAGGEGSHGTPHLPGIAPLPGFDPHGGGAINDIGAGIDGIGTIFGINGQIGADNSLLVSGNINALDNSSGDADHDGIPDFADTNDVSGF